MLKRKISVCLLGAAIFLGGFATGVLGDDTVREITAQISYTINMKLNNEEFSPIEEDGSVLRPIIYAGRTYLPVRALCDALGIAVNYNEATQTIEMGEREWLPLTADSLNSNKGFYTEDPELLDAKSRLFKSGIVVEKSWRNNPYTDVKVKLPSQRTKMKLSIYISGGNKDVKFSDANTGEVYKTVSVRSGEIFDTEFDIKNADEIAITWSKSETDISQFIVGDMSVK